MTKSELVKQLGEFTKEHGVEETSKILSKILIASRIASRIAAMIPSEDSEDVELDAQSNGLEMMMKERTGNVQ